MKNLKFRAVGTLIALSIMSLVVFLSSCGDRNQRDNYLSDKYPKAVHYGIMKDKYDLVVIAQEDFDNICSFTWETNKYNQTYIYWSSAQGIHYSISLDEYFSVQEIDTKGATIANRDDKTIKIMIVRKKDILTPFDQNLSSSEKMLKYSEADFEFLKELGSPWEKFEIQPGIEPPVYDAESLKFQTPLPPIPAPEP